jgi:hypothetical protein
MSTQKARLTRERKQQAERQQKARERNEDEAEALRRLVLSFDEWSQEPDTNWNFQEFEETGEIEAFRDLLLELGIAVTRKKTGTSLGYHHACSDIVVIPDFVRYLRDPAHEREKAEWLHRLRAYRTFFDTMIGAIEAASPNHRSTQNERDESRGASSRTTETKSV